MEFDGNPGRKYPEIYDLVGNQAYMTMNQITVATTNMKILNALRRLSNYSLAVTRETLDEIDTTIKIRYHGLRHNLRACHNQLTIGSTP
jgi:hypothetical protein